MCSMKKAMWKGTMGGLYSCEKSSAINQYEASTQVQSYQDMDSANGMNLKGHSSLVKVQMRGQLT